MNGRLLYVTSQYPFGNREGFLAAEARELASICEHLTVVATHAASDRPTEGFAGDALALRVSGPSLAVVAAEFRRSPTRVAALAGEMLLDSYAAVAKMKNLAVFAKALLLASIARDRRATHIHAHWLTTPSTVALVAARLAGIGFSASAHRFDLYANNWRERKARYASFIRVISERGAQTILEAVAPEDRSKVAVLHLGVDVASSSARIPSRPSVTRFVAVGFLTDVKGHRYLIDAIAAAGDAGITCDIVGDGPLRKNLQARIDQLGLSPRIRLRGYVPHNRLLEELEAGEYDVLVHPSIERGSLHEGIPVSIMEAMSLGIPCIATRTGSIPELIDASCGVLVEAEDIGQLQGALQTLATDRELRARLGAEARARILAEFDVRVTTQILLKWINGPNP